MSVKDFRQLQAKCESEISCGFHLEDILLECCSSDRQNTKYAVKLFSELTAANFFRFFPEDKAKCALAKFIGILAKAFKIMSSRVIFNRENDKWQDALSVHLQEQKAVLMELVYYLEKIVHIVLSFAVNYRFKYGNCLRRSILTFLFSPGLVTPPLIKPVLGSY